MNPILELPEVRARVSPISVEDYHKMGEFNENGKRTELIRGIVIEKMSKSALHRRLAMRAYQRIAKQLPEDAFAMLEQPLTLRDSEPEPDVSVIAGSEDDFATRHPSTALLAVEVSVNTLALDRANAALYAEAGVEEYWIILARERRIEVYRRPVAGTYQEKALVSSGERLESVAVPGLGIDLEELFAMPPAQE